MNELSHYIAAFSHLHTAKIKGYRAPHKAILLLAIIDMVEDGSIATPEIRLTDDLVRVFGQLWRRYLGESAIFLSDISKPYFHMQYEPFWQLVEHRQPRTMMVADGHLHNGRGHNPKELPQGQYSVKAMRQAFACAEMDHALFRLLQQADARAMLRVILISEYLGNQPTKTMPHLQALLAALPLLVLVA